LSQGRAIVDLKAKSATLQYAASGGFKTSYLLDGDRPLISIAYRLYALALVRARISSEGQWRRPSARLPRPVGGLSQNFALAGSRLKIMVVT
jgi:hypothetical protein